MQLHTILDEMILGGQVIEASSEQIVKSVEEIERFSLLPSPLHILSTLLYVSC
jgi:AP-3 complex subunit sigma